MLADVAFPAWVPHPEVWLLVGAIAAGYAYAVKRLGPRLAPTGSPVITRFQVDDVLGRAPRDVGRVRLADPRRCRALLLLGAHGAAHDVRDHRRAAAADGHARHGCARWLLSPRWLLRSVRYLSRLIPATTDLQLRDHRHPHPGRRRTRRCITRLLHFGIHALILVSSLIVWMPLLSPLPEVPRLQPLARMLFLFLQSVVPTVPASFLTFGDHPLYKFYETVPRLWGISALDDMRFAGLIMKILVGFSLWITITVVFFRWYNAEETGPPGAARLARPRPRTDGVAAAMTDTPTEEREAAASTEPATPVPAPPAAAAPAEPTPFWHRPYVERYLVPLVLPVAVIVGLVAYILNISRIFLSGHGHIPIFVGSAITVMILLGAALLSAASPRLRQSAITLISAAFIFSIMSGGWLVLGHSQPENTGPATLPDTLKVTQPVLKVTAAIGNKLQFTPDQLSATTGLAKIEVTVAGAGHTFNLQDPATLFESLSLNAAGTTDAGIAFFPKPGPYTFFCAIPGHEAAGMKGIITVSGSPMTLTQALTAAGNPASAAG